MVQIWKTTVQPRYCAMTLFQQSLLQTVPALHWVLAVIGDGQIYSVMLLFCSHFSLLKDRKWPKSPSSPLQILLHPARGAMRPYGTSAPGLVLPNMTRLHSSAWLQSSQNLSFPNLFNTTCGYQPGTRPCCSHTNKPNISHLGIHVSVVNKHFKCSVLFQVRPVSFQPPPCT